MKTMRSVIAGAVGAGKSTFVRTISDINVIDTDCNPTDITNLLKQQTTVALDFGRVRLNPNMDLHIYGAPGQSRFDFMWDILIQYAQSYILLVAAHRPENFSYTCEIISFINQRAHGEHPAQQDLGIAESVGAIKAIDVGKSGISIGPIAWGMWRFGNSSVAEGRRLIEAAFEAGVTLFDTADIY
ncbi:MAG: hypothetical protein F6K28_29750, partial [Microcoleus sp. SIO2G3]|nr:hypothetical protein [Microcoleus sp. SIO2G3]